MSNSPDTVDMGPPGRPAGWDRPPSLSAQVGVDVAGLSHQGRVRPNNEDHFFIARFGRFLERLSSNLSDNAIPDRSEETGYAAVVADGVGGNAAGEVASRLAINTFVNLLLGTPDWILRLDDATLPRELRRRALDRYDRVATVMAEHALADPTLHGFGTTMTVALSLGKDLLVAHVGDTRAYLLRRQRLRRLTRDHTLAQDMADKGILDQEEVATNRFRHMLTRCLGGQGAPVEPDVQEAVLQDGDCLLLCTDGLTEMVPEPQIEEFLRGGAKAAEACRVLVEEALKAGGQDNVTVVVSRYAFPQSPSA